VSAKSTRASIAYATVPWKEMKEAPTLRVRCCLDIPSYNFTHAKNYQDKAQASARTSGTRSRHKSVARRSKVTRWKSPTQHAQPKHTSPRRVNLPKTEQLVQTSTPNLNRPKKDSCHISWTNYARNPVAATRTLDSAILFTSVSTPLKTSHATLPYRLHQDNHKHSTR
jgi:hypothetical protein